MSRDPTCVGPKVLARGTHEKSKSNTDRRNESSLVLFSRQQQNGEHEERSQEHLDKQALRDRGTATQGGPDVAMSSAGRCSAVKHVPKWTTGDQRQDVH